MKRILLILAILAPMLMMAQKFEVVGTAKRDYDYVNQQWGEWTDWADHSFFIAIDGVEITFYSELKHSYTVVGVEPGVVDSDGDTRYEYRVLDKDGQEIDIVMYKFKNPNTYRQICIKYSNTELVYSILHPSEKHNRK